MIRIRFIAIILSAIFALPAHNALGQEYDGPLQYNQTLNTTQRPVTAKTAKKTTATKLLTLPFFEDFTGYSIYPDSTRWTDYEAYVNNTMGSKPISRGVATLDALNQIGIPYDSFSNTNFRYADSLTSQPIDLRIDPNKPADSIYLSFFYQPQGNSFYPLIQDSLALYFRTKFGGFERVWAVAGSNLKPFKQVMIPINDSLYFDSAFQFRFVNIAALYWSDAVWNIDYIRIDKNRNMYDTLVNDIGFSGNPSFLLNDYTSMPYRQFINNKSTETALQYNNTLHNNWNASEPVTYNFTATALNSGAILQPVVSNTATLSPANIQGVINGAYTTTIPAASVSRYEKVTFENKYFIQAGPATGTPDNDTIVKNIVFDNYLAYDDGSAEKSYYLNLYPTLPGKIAVEYHLNQPDTMRGMSIYFGRQVPFATSKSFSIIVYSQLAGVNGASSDHILLQQDLNNPLYVDTVNHFTTYRFETPLPLPAGTFYAGTLQPPGSGDDSIYFGLDVNRVGGNHAYFNVLNAWNPSLISGAIMMRPLLGQTVWGSAVHDILNTEEQWQLSPNPATTMLHCEFNADHKTEYRITDIQGRIAKEGVMPSDKNIDIKDLLPGMYFVHLMTDGISLVPKKIFKL